MKPITDLLLAHTTDGVTTVCLPEKAFDEGSLDGTREQLLPLADALGVDELRLDFVHVDALGSCALGLLVSLHRRLDRAGGQLVLVNLAPHLQDLFRLTRLDTILDVRGA